MVRKTLGKIRLYFDQLTANNASCLTGDCDGFVQSNGIGGDPQATIVEMILETSKSNLH